MRSKELEIKVWILHLRNFAVKGKRKKRIVAEKRVIVERDISPPPPAPPLGGNLYAEGEE